MTLVGGGIESDNEVRAPGGDTASECGTEDAGRFSDGEGFDGLCGSAVIDSIRQVCEQIDGGGWASAVVGAGGPAVGGGVGFDPVGFVAGGLAGWMLEHVGPLRLVLHQLTGRPEVVESCATTWRDISSRLAERAADQVDVITRGAPDWTGQAAGAYRVAAARTALRTVGASLDARALASASGKMAVVVDTVRGGVRDILADLVGTLLSCVAEAATVGGAPDAARRALRAIAESMIKAEHLLLKLETVIAELGAILADLGQLHSALDR